VNGSSQNLNSSTIQLSASQAENDARLVRVIGGHFQPDIVTDDETDKPFPHLAGNVGQHFVTVAQLDAEHGAGEDGGDGAVEFDGSLLVLRRRSRRGRLGAKSRTASGPGVVSSGTM
jgi:hypothetical protein